MTALSALASPSRAISYAWILLSANTRQDTDIGAWAWVVAIGLGLGIGLVSGQPHNPRAPSPAKSVMTPLLRKTSSVMSPTTFWFSSSRSRISSSLLASSRRRE